MHDDVAEALAGDSAQCGDLVVHKFVQGREEVKLALDVVTRRLELEKARHNLKDLLDNLGLRVPQTILQMIDALPLNEDIHKAVVV